MMQLTQASFPVREVRFGASLGFANGVLEIDRAVLLALMGHDGGLFRSVDADLARPGERTRIIHVIDAIEPRWKASPAGATAFPGFLGPPDVAGTGRTHRLDGVAVLTTENIPGAEGSQGLKEAIVACPVPRPS